MKTVEGVSDAFVDTTARMVLRAEKGAKISEKKLNAALAKAKVKGLKARKLKREKLPTNRAEFTLKMEGFG